MNKKGKQKMRIRKTRIYKKRHTMKGPKLYRYEVEIIKDQIRAYQPNKSIAKDWGITSSMVSHIKAGRGWGGVA